MGWESDVKEAKVLAKEIAAVNRKLFSKMSLEDLKNISTKPLETPESQKNLMRAFNNLSHLVIDDILSADSEKKRTQAMQKWTAVVSELLKIGDFDGATAVFSAFQSTAILRLTNAKQGMASEASELQAFYDLFFVNRMENTEIRLAVMNSVNDIMPHYGSYRTALTSATEGNDPARQRKIKDTLIKHHKSAATHAFDETQATQLQKSMLELVKAGYLEEQISKLKPEDKALYEKALDAIKDKEKALAASKDPTTQSQLSYEIEKDKDSLLTDVLYKKSRVIDSTAKAPFLNPDAINSQIPVIKKSKTVKKILKKYGLEVDLEKGVVYTPEKLKVSEEWHSGIAPEKTTRKSSLLGARLVEEELSSTLTASAVVNKGVDAKEFDLAAFFAECIRTKKASIRDENIIKAICRNEQMYALILPLAQKAHVDENLKFIHDCLKFLQKPTKEGWAEIYNKYLRLEKLSFSEDVARNMNLEGTPAEKKLLEILGSVDEKKLKDSDLHNIFENKDFIPNFKKFFELASPELTKMFSGPEHGFMAALKNLKIDDEKLSLVTDDARKAYILQEVSTQLADKKDSFSEGIRALMKLSEVVVTRNRSMAVSTRTPSSSMGAQEKSPQAAEKQEGRSRSIAIGSRTAATTTQVDDIQPVQSSVTPAQQSSTAKTTSELLKSSPKKPRETLRSRLEKRGSDAGEVNPLKQLEAEAKAKAEAEAQAKADKYVTQPEPPAERPDQGKSGIAQTAGGEEESTSYKRK